MSHLIARLRTLRAKARQIDATLVDDLRPFFGQNQPVFRRLPDGNEEGNVTTTCSCLMSLTTSENLLHTFKSIKKLSSDSSARSHIATVFDHAVRSAWMSSGLPDRNSFSALIVLRTAGLLTQSREKPLEESVLDLIHPTYELKNGKPAEVGSTYTLKQIAEDICLGVPDTLRVEQYDPTPALGYWFIDAVDRLSLPVNSAAWKKTVKWAAREFARQMSLVTSEHAAMMDPVAMAAAACLSTRMRHVIARSAWANGESRDELMRILPTRIELERGVLKAFESQQKSGIWPKYFPLFNYGMGEAGSNYFFSFELLEIIVSEFQIKGRSDSSLLENEIVLDGLERALNWCDSNRLIYRNGSGTYHGWNSGGQITTLSEGKPESWPTAVIHMFLSKLDTALSALIRKHILVKYDAKGRDQVAADTSEWDRFIDGPVQFPDEKETTIKGVIEDEIVKDLRLGEDMQPNDEIQRRRSVLLFGPPGTSKTSLVRGLASKLNWPLVELNPSKFLKSGLENIYQQVEDVFDDLNDVWGSVIFFDEMDALAQMRTDTIDVTRQLLTTSMLPKLSKLHGDRRVLFFMATNHLRNFDPAIKRPGRFDLLVCMAPPKWTTKLQKFDSFYTDDVKKQGYSLCDVLKKLVVNEDTIKLLDLFTFDDFKSFLEHLVTSTTIQKMSSTEFDGLVKSWSDDFITLNTREKKTEQPVSQRNEFTADFTESRRQ